MNPNDAEIGLASTPSSGIANGSAIGPQMALEAVWNRGGLAAVRLKIKGRRLEEAPALV